MAIRGIIFDMDGTLTAPDLEFAKIKQAADIGDVDLLDYLRTATGREYVRIHKLLMRFEAGGVASARLNRGARTVLRYLAQHRFPTALLTRNSRKSVAGVCEKLKFKFDLIITREDGPHKPAPEPIWRIAKHWQMRRAELLMVGDYQWDLLCADNAGIPCAVLLNGAPPPEWAASARYQWQRLTELIDLLEGQRK